jgi:hypothetical protein
MGAFSGAVLGSLVGMVFWLAGGTPEAGLFLTLGGASAGIQRGWLPGLRLSQWINRVIGWSHLWQLAGMITGAMAGSLVGLVFGLAVFPICIGFSTGTILGGLAGRKLWQLGARLGWERVWGVLGAAIAALLGWQFAAWVSAGSLGQFFNAMTIAVGSWIMGSSTNWGLAYLAMGAVGGALGGTVAGIFVDLFARLSGLVD